MLRRILAAAFLVLLGLVLLLVAWPQLGNLSRAAGFAQAVSLRGLAVAGAAVVIVAVGFVALLARPLRRFAASIGVLLLAFCMLNLAVLSTRGFGSLGFETAGDSTVTVLSWNTLGDAPGASAIARLALETDAEIVALPETTTETADEVAAIMAASGAPMRSFTVAFDQVSKARSTSLLVSTSLGDYAVDDDRGNSRVLPTVIATPIDGTGPTVVAVHLVAPIPSELDNWRADLDWVAGVCSGDNVIMAGDFNSTIDHFGGLASADGATIGRCVDAASATDNAAVGTWPTALPPLLSSPIDHIMQTPNWRVAGMRVIENYDDFGSDHRPVLAELVPAG